MDGLTLTAFAVDAIGLGGASAALLYGLARRSLVAGWAVTAVGVAGVLAAATVADFPSVPWAAAAVGAAVLPLLSACAAARLVPPWADSVRFIWASVCLVLAALFVHESRETATPATADDLVSLGMFLCASAMLPMLVHELRRVRDWQGEPVRVGSRELPVEAAPWTLRLLFASFCTGAVVTVVLLAASNAALGAGSDESRPVTDYLMLLAGGSIGLVCAAVAFVTAAEHRAEGPDAAGVLRVRPSITLIVAAAGSAGAWAASVAADGGPYHLPVLAASFAVVAGLLVAEAVLFDVRVLQLCEVDRGSSFVALCCGVTVATAVFWLIARGLWADDQTLGPLAAGGVTVVAVVAAYLTAAIQGLALARPLPMPPVTRDLPWRNVAQDLWLYAMLILLFAVAPAYIFERADDGSPIAIGLALLGLYAVFTAFRGIIETNRVHRKKDEQRRAPLKSRSRDARVLKLLEKRRRVMLRWHHWLQNPLATLMVAGSVGYTFGQLSGVTAVGFVGALLVCWTVGAGWDDPLTVLRRLRRGLDVAGSDMRHLSSHRQGSRSPVVRTGQ